MDSATTHSDLVLRAKQAGVEVRVVHNASIMNAAAACGLQLYLFGHTISMVFFDDTWRPDSWYEKIAANRKMGLHTLCLLGNVRHISFTTGIVSHACCCFHAVGTNTQSVPLSHADIKVKEQSVENMLRYASLHCPCRLLFPRILPVLTLPPTQREEGVRATAIHDHQTVYRAALGGRREEKGRRYRSQTTSPPPTLINAHHWVRV